MKKSSRPSKEENDLSVEMYTALQACLASGALGHADANMERSNALELTRDAIAKWEAKRTMKLQETRQRTRRGMRTAALVLTCALALGGCVDAIILGAIWWDCGIMAMSFDNCRSLKKSNVPYRAPIYVIPEVPQTAVCDRDEFRAAWAAWWQPATPWTPDPERVKLRELEWLRYQRAAEACGVDWR